MAPTQKPIELDGRTGEGGGQLVRVAVALAAVTSQPLRIINVRGNRGGGGGLKNQHVSAVEWLAQATEADVDGLCVGSKTLTFLPRCPPSSLKQRKASIVPGSPVASSMLVFQAVLPFLIFAADGDQSFELDIRAGTNTSMSLSYEYADQILLPALETRFGILVDRQLHKRGWSMGPASRGHVTFKVHPIRLGQGLRLLTPEKRYTDANDYAVSAVDLTIIAPNAVHDELKEALVRDVGTIFPGVGINVKILEDSCHDARVYVLLVAHSNSGLRWGEDILYSLPKKGKGTKNKKTTSPCDDLSRSVTKALFNEVNRMSQCDQHLQDQLVIFQAIAQGITSFPRREHPVNDLEEALQGLQLDDTSKMRKEKTDEPFGEGSLHSQTARWVTAALLPMATFYNKGLVVEGAGISF